MPVQLFFTDRFRRVTVACMETEGNFAHGVMTVTFKFRLSRLFVAFACLLQILNVTLGHCSVSSQFTGAESPLSENGMWSATGSWATLSKNDGAYSTTTTAAAQLASPAIEPDQFAAITYDQDPGSESWAGVMTRIQGPTNGSCYLAIAYAGEVQLYRTDDSGGLSFSLLTSANVDISVAPRLLRLESRGSTHRVYFNGTLLITYTDPNNVYTSGQPGIAAAVFGGPTVKILSFTGGALTGSDNTVPPLRMSGAPAGILSPGTSTATLSLATDEAATCRYALIAGVPYTSMTNTFSTTGGTSHSTTVTGLQDGGVYGYYVRCLDSSGNVNTDDYPITFSIATSSGTVSSHFVGVADSLSDGGMWSTAGSWASLSENYGAYSTNVTSGARLVSPSVGSDQFAEITYDQDPGSASWVGVMTRVQSAINGSGYLAIAYSGQVQLYRTDDSSGLSFPLLASANVDVSVAPRLLRLESQGSTHRVYFNGALLITYTDPNNVYASGQPGIAAAVFGGPTMKILSFTGGALGDATPPVFTVGQPTGALPTGTTSTTLSLTTSEAATCRYATNSGVAYGSMTNTFSTTGGISQSTMASGLQNGNTYSYYVRCQDSAGNMDASDFPIIFSVAGSQAATPTFSPAAGTYMSAQTVTISDSTSGAAIYYTIDGTTPTTSSSVYSGQITISSTETVEAMAVASGYSQSSVGSAVYTITSSPATPTFSPAAGQYTGTQTVIISDSASGATIYYTTDGTTPTTSSSVYSGPITVSSNETLEAIAVVSGYPQSSVGSAAYTITTGGTQTTGTVSYTYDSLGRLHQAQYTTSSGTITVTYSYDSDGNRTSVVTQ